MFFFIEKKKFQNYRERENNKTMAFLMELTMKRKIVLVKIQFSNIEMALKHGIACIRIIARIVAICHFIY